MWIYEKKLEYPVKIRQRNPKLAKIIIEQYGGPLCVRGWYFESLKNQGFGGLLLYFTRPNKKRQDINWVYRKLFFR